MDSVKKRLLIRSGCILPLIIGAFIYIFSGDNLISSYLGTRLGVHVAKIGFPAIIRNHLCDYLWAYSLVHFLYVANRYDNEKLKTIFVLSLSFSLLMEGIQLIPLLNMTFDPADIVVEVLAEVSALFVIKYIGGQYDEKN